MFDTQELPSIAPKELAEWMQLRPDLVLLDVREPFELRFARLDDSRVVNAPISVLAQSSQPALPPAALNPDATIVVFCHHGIRSAQVVWWLRQTGWQHIYNLAGGIDAYAREVDPAVGFY